MGRVELGISGLVVTRNEVSSWLEMMDQADLPIGFDPRAFLRRMQDTFGEEVNFSDNRMWEALIAELVTHFGEIAGITRFDHYYPLIDGIMRDDILTQRDVRKMYLADTPVDRMWRAHLIPYFEQAEEKSMAMYISAKNPKEMLEGNYDIVYFFQKVQSGVQMVGYLLDLGNTRQVEILEYLISLGGDARFDTSRLDAVTLSHEEVRAMAITFTPVLGMGINDLIAEVIGDELLQGGVDGLGSHAVLEQMRLAALMPLAKHAAREVLAYLANDLAELELVRRLAEHQMRMVEQSPYSSAQVLLGEVVMRSTACGMFPESLPADFGYPVQNWPILANGWPILTESDQKKDAMKCVKCPFCQKTVDAIVTPRHIECPKCHKKVEKK